MGTATRELYVQFFLRVYKEIPDSILASFSTLKFVSSPNFSSFRDYFNAFYIKGFICKANTFDNVKGQFPIGFLIWKVNSTDVLNSIQVDTYDENGNLFGTKGFRVTEKNKYFINWFRPFIDRTKNELGSLHIHSNDIQQQNVISISSVPTQSDLIQKTFTYITAKNLFECSIYYAVRHCIEPTWLNNRDQYLYPNNAWSKDEDFKNDCLTFTLFSNNIQFKFGTNHWIPFTEQEVNSREKFQSNFMTQFISGKLKTEQSSDLFGTQTQRTTPLVFSPEATDVMNAGRELWKYYHKQPDCNVNASLYDIREHFQGRN